MKACAAYNHPDNKLRASVLSRPPIFERKNTKDNTPAVVKHQSCQATRWT